MKGDDKPLLPALPSEDGRPSGPSDFVYERLARGWLNYQSGCTADRRFWDLMNVLTREDPEAAWRVTLRMLALAPSMDMIATIGASPLEELLTREAPRFVYRAESLAVTNSAFRAALPFVWLPECTSREAWQLLVIGCQCVSAVPNGQA